MSIVVPVHDKAGYLRRCVRSLARQRAPRGGFEVILVDDGSTDGSGELCDKLATELPFARALHKANGGVSSARNAGMRAARGEWIMFLDADDELARGAVARVAAACRRWGAQTDVVAYRIRYRDSRTGRTWRHARERFLPRSGLYPLETNPYIAQSTMNVCVRNRGEEGAMFDEAMRMGEDQLFVTRCLEGQAALAYCREAEYVYERDGSGASLTANDPLFAWDDMMRLYDGLLEVAGRGRALARYARQLVLYNLAWRLRAGKLLPSGEAGPQAQARLADIVRACGPAEVAASPYLSERHKAYLIKSFGLAREGALPEYTSGAARLTLADGTAWKTDPPGIAVERCTLRGGVLEIRGRLECPLFLFEDSTPTLTVDTGDGAREVALGPSSHRYDNTGCECARAWSFALTLAAQAPASSMPATSTPAAQAPASPARARLRATIRGTELPDLRIKLSPNAHNARILGTTALFRRAALEARAGELLLRARTPADAARCVAHDTPHPKDIARRVAVRHWARMHRGERIWMYADLPTSPAEGNALAQMLHDLKEDDGIKRYYVSDFGPQLTSRHPELAGRIIRCKSRNHACMAVRAELVLASYLERFTHMPFKRETYDQIGDLAADQRRIYLQRGVLCAHMPWYLSYDRIAFDYAVISTSFEARNLQEGYGFPEGALIRSGAPRLDLVSPAGTTGTAEVAEVAEAEGVAETARAKAAPRRIVYAPSWRNYLVGRSAYERTGNDAAFSASSFFRGAVKLLRQASESGILEELDLILDVKLHPYFECYRHLFCDWGTQGSQSSQSSQNSQGSQSSQAAQSSQGSRVRLADDDIDPSSYTLAITDWSSYAFDFAYAGANIVYFVPDAREFRAGLNHYSKLDWPLEEGLGPYCETAGETLGAVRAMLEKTLPQGEARLYAKRRKGLFLHADSRNRERLYEAALGIAAGLGR